MKRLSAGPAGIVIAATLSALLACSRDTPPDSSVPANEASAETEPRATPYAVGSSTFFIHDESRPFDAPAGVDTGVRVLVTEIWYPVEHSTVEGPAADFRRATYGDYVFGNREVHRLMMTATTFFHMTPETVREEVTESQIEAAISELFDRERTSFVDAPVADTENRLPVVVMSHGDAGSRYNMETVCEFLAANGYFVIAADHTGNSPYAMIGSDPALAADAAFRDAMQDVIPLLGPQGTYGSEENFGQSYTPLASGRGSFEFLVSLDASLLQRLNDLRAVLAQLDALDQAGRFAGRLDLARIGLMGRSFGGMTTIMALAMEERFSAGFAVVPPGWLDPRPALPPEALRDSESVLLASEGSFPLTTLNKPTFLLSGAEDRLIIALGASMAEQAGLGPPTPDNPHPVLRSVYESAAAPVAWGLLENSNHATFGVSGSYWWPDLKPSMQESYFNPGRYFALADVQAAHEMQKQKALAFFDLTIRGDQSALSALYSNEFAEGGLRLEFRHFQDEGP